MKIVNFFLLLLSLGVLVHGIPTGLRKGGQLRIKRETKDESIGKSEIDYSHSKTLLDNRDHQVDGTFSVAKPHQEPAHFKGELDYLHKNTGATAKLEASHMQGSGTRINTHGQLPFQSANGRVKGNASGFFAQNFGRNGRRSAPDFGVFMNMRY